MVKRTARGGVWSVRGYFCDISWDGATLRVHGRNRAAREFFNEADPQVDLQVTASDITKVDFQPASFTRNGVLTILTTDGITHSVYALRQHNSNFFRLADVLRLASPIALTSVAVPASAPPDEVAAAGTPADPIELLERLAKLREAGVLTGAEFETKKAELLRRI